MGTNNQKKVYYRRFQKPKFYHFCPAPGYNCPKIPLGGINVKGLDYEIVKVVRAENCLLKNRRVIISWGLNIDSQKWPKLKQVIAVPVDFPNQKFGEIVLAID